MGRYPQAIHHYEAVLSSLGEPMPSSKRHLATELFKSFSRATLAGLPAPKQRKKKLGAHSAYASHSAKSVHSTRTLAARASAATAKDKDGRPLSPMVDGRMSPNGTVRRTGFGALPSISNASNHHAALTTTSIATPTNAATTSLNSNNITLVTPIVGVALPSPSSTSSLASITIPATSSDVNPPTTAASAAPPIPLPPPSRHHAAGSITSIGTSSLSSTTVAASSSCGATSTGSTTSSPRTERTSPPSILQTITNSTIPLQSSSIANVSTFPSSVNVELVAISSSTTDSATSSSLATLSNVVSSTSNHANTNVNAIVESSSSTSSTNAGTLPLSNGSVHSMPTIPIMNNDVASSTNVAVAASSIAISSNGTSTVASGPPSVAFAANDQVLVVPSSSSEPLLGGTSHVIPSSSATATATVPLTDASRGMSRAVTNRSMAGGLGSMVVETSEEKAKRIEHARLMRLVQVLEKLVKAGLVIGEPWRAGYCAFKMATLAARMDNDAVLALSYSQCASACLELTWLPLAQVCILISIHIARLCY
jgi:hypothetical protein